MNRLFVILSEAKDLCNNGSDELMDIQSLGERSFLQNQLDGPARLHRNQLAQRTNNVPFR